MTDHTETGQARWRVTDIDRCIASKLRTLRARRGIHPQLLDCAIGAPPGTVWRYEEGARPIGAVHLYRLSRLLDTPLEDFFRETACAAPRIDPPRDIAPPAGAPTPAEAQRFLALYEKLADPDIKQSVRELLQSVSEAEH